MQFALSLLITAAKQHIIGTAHWLEQSPSRSTHTPRGIFLLLLLLAMLLTLTGRLVVGWQSTDSLFFPD